MDYESRITEFEALLGNRSLENQLRLSNEIDNMEAEILGAAWRSNRKRINKLKELLSIDIQTA